MFYCTARAVQYSQRPLMTTERYIRIDRPRMRFLTIRESRAHMLYYRARYVQEVIKTHVRSRVRALVT